jgi:hypothetical protein
MVTSTPPNSFSWREKVRPKKEGRIAASRNARPSRAEMMKIRDDQSNWRERGQEEVERKGAKYKDHVQQVPI